MFFSMTAIAFDFGYVPVLPFFFQNDIDTRGRGLGVTTLSPSFSAALRTLMVVLVLLWVGGGSLLSGRILFSTRRVSRGGVGRLILSTGVLLLLLSEPIPSGTPRVYVASTGRGLEHCFCLCVDGFLLGLFSGVQVPTLGIYLGPDGRFQALQDVSDHDLLVRSCTAIKLLEDYF